MFGEVDQELRKSMEKHYITKMLDTAKGYPMRSPQSRHSVCYDGDDAIELSASKKKMLENFQQSILYYQNTHENPIPNQFSMQQPSFQVDGTSPNKQNVGGTSPKKQNVCQPKMRSPRKRSHKSIKEFQPFAEIPQLSEEYQESTIIDKKKIFKSKEVSQSCVINKDSMFSYNISCSFLEGFEKISFDSVIFKQIKLMLVKQNFILEEDISDENIFKIIKNNHLQLMEKGIFKQIDLIMQTSDLSQIQNNLKKQRSKPKKVRVISPQRFSYFDEIKLDLEQKMMKHISYLTKGVKLKKYCYGIEKIQQVTLTFTYDFKFMGVKEIEKEKMTVCSTSELRTISSGLKSKRFQEYVSMKYVINQENAFSLAFPERSFDFVALDQNTKESSLEAIKFLKSCI